MGGREVEDDGCAAEWCDGCAAGWKRWTTKVALLGGKDMWTDRKRGDMAGHLLYYNNHDIDDFQLPHFLRRLDRSRERFPYRENTMASIYRARRMFLCKEGAVNVWNPPSNVWTRQMQISIFCNSEMNKKYIPGTTIHLRNFYRI